LLTFVVSLQLGGISDWSLSFIIGWSKWRAAVRDRWKSCNHIITSGIWLLPMEFPETRSMKQVWKYCEGLVLRKLVKQSRPPEWQQQKDHWQSLKQRKCVTR
jgi:hypothetical protein